MTIQREPDGTITPHRYYLVGWFPRDGVLGRQLEEYGHQGDARSAAAAFAAVRGLGVMSLEIREIHYAGPPERVNVRPSYQADP